jgi:hypothetical protein
VIPVTAKLARFNLDVASDREGKMLSKRQNWHQALSHRFGYWVAKNGSSYSCPFWADKDAFTLAYLHGKGIIESHEIA